MKLRLSWSKTGDNFFVIPIYSEFTEWFIEESDQRCNQWTSQTDDIFLKDFHADTNLSNNQQLIDTLIDHLNIVNELLTKLKIKNIPLEHDYYNQQCLNATHKQWIKLIRNIPKIDELIYKLDPDTCKKFHDINNLIHKIENNFHFRLVTTEYWKVENKFVNHKWGSNDYCNISLPYNDFGKSSYDKWLNNDDDPNDFELSNHKTVSGRINISLNYPYTCKYSNSYVQYCSKHNIEPVPKNLPLANIDSMQNLAIARQIMENNIHQNNNFLFLETVYR